MKIFAGPIDARFYPWLFCPNPRAFPAVVNRRFEMTDFGYPVAFEELSVHVDTTEVAEYLLLVDRRFDQIVSFAKKNPLVIAPSVAFLRAFRFRGKAHAPSLVVSDRRRDSQRLGLCGEVAVDAIENLAMLVELPRLVGQHHHVQKAGYFFLVQFLILDDFPADFEGDGSFDERSQPFVEIVWIH